MKRARRYQHARGARLWPVAVAAALVVLYLVTAVVGVVWNAHPSSAWLAEGSLGYVTGRLPGEYPPDGLGVELSKWRLDLDFDYRVRARSTYVEVALWPLPLGAIALAAWRCRWRTETTSACVKCGYDAEGLTSGVCPECGEATAVE